MKATFWAIIVGFLAVSSLSAQGTPSQPQSAPPAAIPTMPSELLVAQSNGFTPVECVVACQPNPARCFLEADYLVWWVKRAPLPAPLITTDPNFGFGLPPDFTGALGEPSTKALIDSSDMNYGSFSGLRLRGGLSAEPFSLELSGFFLEYRNASDAVNADQAGIPFIGQTFFDTLINRENAYFVSAPLFSSGTVSVSHPIQFYGAQANAAIDLGSSGCWSCNAFVGFRFQGLDEHLTIDENITSLVDMNFPDDVALFYRSRPVFLGGSVAIQDTFRTSNRFYGGQVGGLTRWTWNDALSFAFRGSLAYGVNQQTVSIQGLTTFSPGPQDVPPPELTYPGGIYAQPSNSGRFFRNVSSFIPEGEVTAEWHVAANWTLKLGYSFMYWTNVVRPGSQFNRRLNRESVATDRDFNGLNPATDPFAFQNSDFWAQGFNFGIEWRF